MVRPTATTAPALLRSTLDVQNDTASAPGAITRRFVSWTLRHGKLLWAIAILLAIPATWRTATLYRHLRSEIEELLPRSAPSVVAIDELRHRMAGLQYLGVLVDVGSPDRLAAGERFLDDLAARVRAYPQTDVSDVRTGFAAERAFVENHAAALLDLEDLKTIRQRIEDRLHWEYGKETGTLLDDTRAGAAARLLGHREEVRRPSWAAPPWRGRASPARSWASR